MANLLQELFVKFPRCIRVHQLKLDVLIQNLGSVCKIPQQLATEIGEAVGLLRPSADTTVEIAPALDAGRHELRLAPVVGAEVAAPKAAGATYFQDATSYESCIAQVMARTANQSMQDRQAALDNPYYWCPDRPAAAAAPAPLPAYVLVVTTSGAPDAAILLRELGDLDLSGPIAMLSERVGAIVVRSAGAASPAFASATSRW